MERAYTSSREDDAVRTAFDWLLDAARASGVSRAAIVVPPPVDELAQKVATILGLELTSDRTAKRGDVTVEVRSQRGLPFGAYDGPMLSVWNSADIAQKLERLHPPAICLVPWVEGELDDWALTHQARDLLTDTTPTPVAVPLAVVGALPGMIGRDVLHPGDKRRAVEMLKALDVAGVQVEPAQIEAEAIRQGWESRGAARLREMAEKIAAGKTLQGAPRPTKGAAKESVARWTAAAAANPLGTSHL